jgi:hypothetical protein
VIEEFLYLKWPAAVCIFFNPSPPNRHFLDTIKELELLTCVVEIKQLEMEEGC